MYAGPLERYQMKQKEANWYGLEMLPKYLMMGKEQLHEAEKQLQMLKTCENRPYVLDDFLVNRIIKIYTEQNEMLWVPVEQCSKWRKQSPRKDQLSDIMQVENNSKNLFSTNEQILSLAQSLKKGTVDSVLRKSDIENALDYMSYSNN